MNQIINKLDQKELEQIFKYFGEEKNSKLISKKIVLERQKKSLDTQDLVNIVKRVKKKHYTKTNPATKVFQALRIFVNKEISELQKSLEESARIVSQNGIILTVSFHSLEDKICKFFFNYLSKQDKVSRYLPEKKTTKKSFSLITKKPVTPSSQELKLNPPSRSAKLRAIKNKLVFSIYFFPEVLLMRISVIISNNKINKIHSFFLISFVFTDSISDSDTVSLSIRATSANTASKIVARDASGDFAAGMITADLTGDVTGSISGGTVAGSTGTFTGDVDIADKIVHTGDTNTAIRFPAADSVRIDTAGSNRFKIDSNGRIGILDPNLDNFDSVL